MRRININKTLQQKVNDLLSQISVGNKVRFDSTCQKGTKRGLHLYRIGRKTKMILIGLTVLPDVIDLSLWHLVPVAFDGETNFRRP